MSKSKILFQLSGSIACYKACAVISRLVHNGHEVQTATTEGALNFIGEATLEGLTGRPVFKDSFHPGQMMDHINLAKWADLAVLCPASGHTINSLAHGLAGNAVGALFLAYDLKKSYLVAPAMNQQMMAHPAVQKSLGILKEWGVVVLPSDFGPQACGDIGLGRLLEPDQIYDFIVSYLKLVK